MAEKLIDDLKTGKRTIKPFVYSDVYLFTIFQYINTYGKLPDSFWDVYAYFDDSSITKEEYIGIYGELKICETCKQLIWKSYGKWMLRSYVYPADKINPGIVVGRRAEFY